MVALDLVRLLPLMERSRGKQEVVLALVDGPVAVDHAGLAGAPIRVLSGGACSATMSEACQHGTFVAGILSASRGSGAPSIAPGCMMLVRPIFAEVGTGDPISVRPDELADAVVECIEAGAHVVNLSVGLARMSLRGEAQLEEALHHAARRGVLIVAAAGNQADIGSTAITRHPWVIPVVACDGSGRPLGFANLGRSIGRSGLLAPGEAITSLHAGGQLTTSSGTSAAAPFVSGAIVLLRSVFPDAPASAVRQALMGARPRRALVPPLLDAWRAFQILSEH